MDELETGGKGKDTTFKRMTQPLKIQHKLLRPTRSKMAEDSSSSRPWTLSHAHYNTSVKWHTHRHHDKLEANHKSSKSEWCPNPWKSPPLLQIECCSHSLAYETTHPIKTNQPYSSGGYHFLRQPQGLGLPLPPSKMAHTLSMEYVFL